MLSYFVILYHTQNYLNPYSLDLHRKGIGVIAYTIKVQDILIKKIILKAKI